VLNGYKKWILGSVLCAFAPSLPFLIAFRAVQGSGGGRLKQLWISLLFGAFPEKERGVAFGIYGIPLIVAPASVHVLGGFFVEYLIWHLKIRFLSIYPYSLSTTSDISLRALISDSVWKE